MWGTDMTATVTVQHGQVAVFVAIDHCSAECVGIHAALTGTRHEALEPVRQGVIPARQRRDSPAPAQPPDHGTMRGPGGGVGWWDKRAGIRARFGAIGKEVAAGLSLRHDHGSQYMSHDFRTEIRWLGIASSPAFIRAPEGNGCAERFIRTVKENLLWVRTFETVEELRQALLAFRET